MGPVPMVRLSGWGRQGQLVWLQRRLSLGFATAALVATFSRGLRHRNCQHSTISTDRHDSSVLFNLISLEQLVYRRCRVRHEGRGGGLPYVLGCSVEGRVSTMGEQRKGGRRIPSRRKPSFLFQWVSPRPFLWGGWEGRREAGEKAEERKCCSGDRRVPVIPHGTAQCCCCGHGGHMPAWPRARSRQELGPPVPREHMSVDEACLLLHHVLEQKSSVTQRVSNLSAGARRTDRGGAQLSSKFFGEGQSIWGISTFLT